MAVASRALFVFAGTGHTSARQWWVGFMRPRGVVVAAFEHLAALAGYDLSDQGVVYLFTRNLKRGLLSTILHCQKTPETFAQWKEAVCNELQVME